MRRGGGREELNGTCQRNARPSVFFENRVPFNVRLPPSWLIYNSPNMAHVTRTVNRRDIEEESE